MAHSLGKCIIRALQGEREACFTGFAHRNRGAGKPGIHKSSSRLEPQAWFMFVKELLKNSFLSGIPQLLLLRLSTLGMKPIPTVEGNWLYSKAGDCRGSSGPSTFLATSSSGAWLNSWAPQPGPADSRPFMVTRDSLGLPPYLLQRD